MLTTTSDNTGILVGRNIFRLKPLFSGIDVIFFSSIVELNPNCQFLDRTTVEFVGRVAFSV
jgi:predicted metal-binding protein